MVWNAVFAGLIGYILGVAHCQIPHAYPVKFVHNLGIFGPHHESHYPSEFAGAHEHPVLTRMRHRDYQHFTLDRHQIRGKHDKRDGVFGNFDPNKFNSQIGANFNPNALNGGSGSSTSGGMSMFNPNAMMGGGTSSGGMFNPNAMMGGGGQQGSSSSTGTGQTQQQQPGSSSQSGTGSAAASSFNPNSFGGSSSSQTGTGTGSPSSGGSGSSSGGSMPHYDPNNVVNTGAKYDPNAANSGMGAASGGSSPSFANGMGLNAQQQMPPGASSWAGTGSGSSSPGSSSSGSSGSGQSPGASSGGSSSSTFDPNSFGSSSSSSGSSGSPSSGSAPSAAASFGSSSGSSGGPQSQSGSQPQTQTGSGSHTGGNTGGSSGGSSFDPVKTNSLATAGFNPLNPMIGKDMTQLMGPQSQTGSKGPGNFDPGAVNTQMGKTGMSLNMFGGAGGNTNLNKVDASSLMGGAQGMMAGATAINSGGNAFMSGGSQTGGGFGQTGGSSTSGSSGVNFDPNAMMGGGSSGGSSGSSMFNPSAMMGGGSGGTGSGSGSGGMFNPNAMLGGGSVNPMSPGGNMNPMMPGSSMTGSSSSSRNTGSNPILDPMGAMSGSARNFSGGSSLIDPMGFMNGGGLSGSMTNKFGVPLGGRSVPIVGTDRLRRDTPHLNWRHGNFFNSATGQAYNPMDPMGFIFEGNNKHYTKGNGVDTPTYDPDQYSYTYAGTTFSSFPAMPSTGGAFIPSYQHAGPNPMNQDGVKRNDSSSTSDGQEEMLPNEHSSASGRITENFQKLLINANMYPHAVYSGVPGMLGLGSQTRMTPPEFTAPSFVGQYTDPSYENLTTIHIPQPSYSGVPGMQGAGSQTQGSISSAEIAGLPKITLVKQSGYGRVINSSGTTNAEPVYSGIPGMLGEGSMIGLPGIGTGRATHTFGNSKAGNDEAIGHSNDEPYRQGFGFQTESGTMHSGFSQSNAYGMGTVQQTNVNSWNGDWPGLDEQKSSEQTKNHGGTSGDFGNSENSRSGFATAWDGNWPGQSSQRQDHGEKSQAGEGKGGSESTIEALKNLISQLNKFPAADVKESKDAWSSSGSFAESVSDWNKELRNDRRDF